MDVDAPTMSKVDALRAKSRARSQSNRRDDGVTNEVARSKAERLNKLGQKKMNRMARQGEADRHTTAALPKHLVSCQNFFPIPYLFSGCGMLGFANCWVIVFWKAWYGQDATEVMSWRSVRIFWGISSARRFMLSS